MSQRTPLRTTSRRRLTIGLLCALGIALAVPTVAAAAPDAMKPAAASPKTAAKKRAKAAEKKAKKQPKKKGTAPPLWTVIPFVLCLLGIAVLPLTAEHFWENNLNKFIISCVLGIPVGIYFLVTGSENQHHLTHVIYEYIAFMALLGSLYVISGGILLKADLAPTPMVNTGFLAVGSLLASFMGTTGAAMLLIRPMITINAKRENRVHTIVFFTFLVANIGGLLTPLGDPPLFMGYLRGVPFTWTFSLTPDWALMVASILVVYYVWDTMLWRKDPISKQPPKTDRAPTRMSGGVINFPLLAGVVLCVAFGDKFPVLLGPKQGGIGVRELAMLGLAASSWFMTPRALRKENEYTFGPILEVAALFLGIFLTMIPAVVLLKVRGGELGVTEPWQFFWATGSLSAFLDNTPTYVVFFALAEGDPCRGLSPEAIQGVKCLFSSGLRSSMVHPGIPEKILAAMSTGAVFMGAMTYIGNGPNFMVKAIADERGIRMPSFFGYMIYSVIVLVPLFVVYTLLFY